VDRQTSRAGVRVGRLRDTVRRHPCLADGLLAVVLAILTTPDVVRHGSESPLAIAFHLALWVPIAFRRRAPELVFGGIAAIAFVQWMVSVPVAGDAAMLVALYTVAAHRRLDRALAAAVVLEFGVVLAVLRWATGPSNLRLLILLTGMVLAALLLGVTQRSRRAYLAQLVGRAERLERERDQQAQLATAAERTRIAREMHDIVAHSLSVMITLADGAALTDRPDQARAALHHISRTGRDALADTRRVLGVLRADPAAEREPQPGLDRLDALLTAVRATGLAVDLVTTGRNVPTTAAAQTAVYRIVQEALTNTVKHADSVSHVVVRLTYRPGGLGVQISDDGGPSRPTADRGAGGHGLVGIRERVSLFGGTLHAGPGPVRGWQVTADLRLDDAEPDVETDVETDVERVAHA